MADEIGFDIGSTMDDIQEDENVETGPSNVEVDAPFVAHVVEQAEPANEPLNVPIQDINQFLSSLVNFNPLRASIAEASSSSNGVKCSWRGFTIFLIYLLKPYPLINYKKLQRSLKHS